LRLLVLGASGGIGSWFTRLASQRGHDVTAVVRPRASVDTAGVAVKRGDVTDPTFLREVVAGHDVVVSCLGLRRAGKSPFARLLSPADLTERVTRILIDVMRSADVRRIVIVSAGGVRDSFAHLTWPVKRLVTTANVGVAYRDLAKMEEIVERSGLDWLLVRPVTLTGGEPTGRARLVERYGLFSTIRRADVAEWMLQAIETSSSISERRVLLG
jgi:putative NADH-flavin reductase